jgi:hypothetical protein
MFAQTCIRANYQIATFLTPTPYQEKELTVVEISGGIVEFSHFTTY